ncbi:proline-specific permease [Colletotrichum truncatum]|uniref:Proline-specific permease n=1 Tax=Colletotrichum truncatum TaxID=5467 RepID=A0ACC3Z5W9_COLTU|nr:proline-specific permease [Colletotrichum truncatum]KAF6787207.1 proline-specific permease [Colletotrichum truncatum]
MRNSDEETIQFETFRDCLSAAIVERVTKPASKPKRRAKKTKSASPQKKKSQNENTDEAPVDADDMMEFSSYIASEAFESFPEDLKTLTHVAYTADSALQSRCSLPLTGSDVADLLPTLSPAVADSLVAYNIIDPDRQGSHEFLAPVLTEYVSALIAAPPPPRSTRDQAEGCELCGRDWIGLTYHHLIPRMVHDKVVKRGWHREDELNNVAWLCRLCHSFVHRFAGHEDLARYYYTVDLLLEQDEVVKFAQYASRVRWKGR